MKALHPLTLVIVKTRILIGCGLLIPCGVIHAISLAPEITAYLSSGSVTEFGTLAGTSAQVAGFTDFVKGNWSEILNDLDTVAPDERRQQLLISAAESLPPSDYMDFLSLLLDKHQENKVKKAVAVAALSPGARKYGFLAFNDQHAQVRALCERAKTIFADVADLQDLMNETLSGEQRKQIGAALASESRAQPEILPTP